MNILPAKWNLTIRMRLTALYAGAFFIAGSLLIGMMYLQLHQVIGQQLIYRSVIVSSTDDGGPGRGPPTTFQLEKDPPAGGVPAPAPSRITAPLPADWQEPEGAQRLRQARVEMLRRVMLVSVTSLVVVGVVAALLGWLLAGQALQPLRQITATVRGIADRNLHQRVAMDGPQDEVKDLADTLDDMLERLNRAFDSQQRFIANASHELRTPLAINRTLIEVAMLKESGPDSPLARVGSTLLAVNERHEHLIDGLLMLAGSEQEIADPQHVDLSQVARHVLSDSAPMAKAAGVELRPNLAAAGCRGDPVLLERVIHNLVDNAIRYNLQEGGWIAIATGTDAQGRATLSVENPGSVIPPYEVPRLFEPFRRLSSTERLAEGPGRLGRRGAGLGLSIVRAIVTTHRSEVHAMAREAGGLCVRVVLPG
jgi:signal transduction histidine kinase